jgi:AcrR family transcriptional regulator
MTSAGPRLNDGRRTGTGAAQTRETSAEPRDHVIRAAVLEFAEHGYAATNTTAIARPVGISQPHVYALFSTKRELFLAAHDWHSRSWSTRSPL